VSRRIPVDWTFLTHHGQALLCIAGDPGVELADLGERIGISETAVRRIVGELADAGYITRERDGRGSRYAVDSHLPLPDPIARELSVGVLVDVLVGPHLTHGPSRSGSASCST
jgi:DNA-binding transcriptional ArsR family regulator